MDNKEAIGILLQIKDCAEELLLRRRRSPPFAFRVAPPAALLPALQRTLCILVVSEDGDGEMEKGDNVDNKQINWLSIDLNSN